MRRFVVKGRVQGVGFRFFVHRTASSLGLAGQVRNCSDGSVEVIASGNEDQLTQLTSHLAQGPTAAQVDSVETHPAAAHRFSSFHIA